MSNSSSGVEAMVLGGSSSCRYGGRLWVVRIWRGAGVQKSESKAVVNNDKESVLKLVSLQRNSPRWRAVAVHERESDVVAQLAVPP